LGSLRCATITCRSVEDAAALYQRSLGFDITERGVVSAALAASWNAPACEGAAYAVLAPPSGETTYLRFVEDARITAPTPYSTFGWVALEFTVQSSDRAVESLQRNGFDVIGPPQDLAFSKGALRAGQVSGPLGEILYLTQINAQLPDYVLPTSDRLVGRMFIVISCIPGVDEGYRRYAQQLGAIYKEPFHAEVPFMAKYHGLPPEHSYYVGCMECVPRSYIEIDEMPSTVVPRPRLPGHLPAGISMVSFEVPSLDPFRQRAQGTVAHIGGSVYADADSLALEGPYGEWIELIECGASPEASS
jgi:catechol 2,3-dioxygenase-like lactoylglutathione lyase family enzyme